MSGQQYSNVPEAGQTGGPHPTMIANIIDPNVNADGMKSGRGVGGTSEHTIKDEAREHIHTTGGQPTGGNPITGGLDQSQGYDQRSTGLGQGQGYDQRSTGLGQGQAFDNGSSTGRSAFNEPSATQQHNQGIDHIRSSAGLERQPGLDSSNTSAYSSNTGAGYDSTTTSGPHSSNLANKADPRVDSDQSSSRNYGADSSSTNPSSRSGLTGSDANTRDTTSVGDTHGVDSQARAGTASGGHDLEDSKSHSEQTSDHPGKGQGGYIGKPTDDDGKSGPPPSIPTAGGERIGTKHWGESKIVPDNPPRRPSETGVSSSAGQPDDLTKHNTASNTGGASSTDTTEKESMMDKIKDKIGMGHK